MRKFAASTLLAAATIGLVAASAPSASAAPTWTVKNSNSDGSFTGLLDSGSPARFTDRATSESFTCTSSSLLGIARSGTDRDVPMTISAFAYSSCSGPLGSTGSGNLSGTYSADSYDATTGTTLGQIAEGTVNLTINSELGTCKATMTGAVTVNYANSGLLISATIDLTVTTVSGACAGLVSEGDNVTYGAVYDIIPVLTFTSP
ncbi:MAG TPA: hypothetical protein VFQ44_16735 [Streptosporangiaceae bacterium]|nr:hypothetical protein [Streptosporangiaceae bacterium]